MEQEAFRFTPQVPPKTEKDAVLVAKVDERRAQKLEMALKRKRKREKEKAPAFVQESLPEDPSHKFLEEKYYAILRSVCTDSVSGQGSCPGLSQFFRH